MVLVALIATSAYFVLSHHCEAKRATDLYNHLVSIVEQPTGNETKSPDAHNKSSRGIKPILLNSQASLGYRKLNIKNTDMIGWIRIDGTRINYPVMHTPNKPDFYLYRAFDKSYSIYGCHYLQDNCDLHRPSDNFIIYGHHMNDGSMFSDLVKYASKDFYNSHKIIHFDTLSQKNDYEVIAAFSTSVDEGKGFRYYDFVNAYGSEDYDSYIKNVRKLSYYDTGKTAEFGKKLLTLSTCEYTHNNGRMVVVAKLIRR
jgi:sortase B